VKDRLHGNVVAPGLAHAEAVCEYLWDSHAAAIACDTYGVEVFPADRSAQAHPFGFLHSMLIGQFGMALGELWWLSDLIGAHVRHRLGQQGHRQFLGDFAQQGLQVGFCAFPLAAGDVEDVFPAWPGAEDLAVLQMHPGHRVNEGWHQYAVSAAPCRKIRGATTSLVNHCTQPERLEP
jgi:hypothetical protein